MVKRILLIDDDSDERLLFSEAIHEIAPEITCMTESDGRKALALFEKQEFEVPDVIFLDINMPTLDGWHCLTKLKSADASREVPVIMYSTSSRPGDVDKAKEYGALGLYTKAGDFKEMKKSLRRILNDLKEESYSSHFIL